MQIVDPQFEKRNVSFVNSHERKQDNKMLACECLRCFPTDLKRHARGKVEKFSEMWQSRDQIGAEVKRCFQSEEKKRVRQSSLSRERDQI